jgi:hypothetical protein
VAKTEGISPAKYRRLGLLAAPYSFGKATLKEHQVLAGDLSASNTIENPDRVKPVFMECSAAVDIQRTKGNNYNQEVIV